MVMPNFVSKRITKESLWVSTPRLPPCGHKAGFYILACGERVSCLTIVELANFRTRPKSNVEMYTISARDVGRK